MLRTIKSTTGCGRRSSNAAQRTESTSRSNLPSETVRSFRAMLYPAKKHFLCSFMSLTLPQGSRRPGSRIPIKWSVSFNIRDNFAICFFYDAGRIAAGEGRFNINSEVVINSEVKSVPVTKKGIYFAFRDQGACISLLAIKVILGRFRGIKKHSRRELTSNGCAHFCVRVKKFQPGKKLIKYIVVFIIQATHQRLLIRRDVRR